MKEYIVAVGNHLRRLNQLGQDHYEECVFQTQKVFCTQQYLRDRLREMFNNRVDHNPFLVIQTASPNHIIEGLKISGWGSDENGGDETVTGMLDAQSWTIEITNISRFQILS